MSDQQEHIVLDLMAVKELIERQSKDIEDLKDLLRRGLDFAGHAQDVPSKEDDAKKWESEVREVIRK